MHSALDEFVRFLDTVPQQGLERHRIKPRADYHLREPAPAWTGLAPHDAAVPADPSHVVTAHVLVLIEPGEVRRSVHRVGVIACHHCGEFVLNLEYVARGPL